MMYFPHPLLAREDGLLAIGGDLSTERLKLAYSFGIFPWYGDNEPIMWWSPRERFVLFPEKIKTSKSMRNYINRKVYTVTVNQGFGNVISHCRTIKREGQSGTWITSEMKQSYMKLHEMGLAHSVEVWNDNQLVGGLYGVCLGKIFFGESMFSYQPNASKYGFISFVNYLKKLGCQVVDCQIYSEHLSSLGAETYSNINFFRDLKNNIFEENLKIESGIVLTSEES